MNPAPSRARLRACNSIDVPRLDYPLSVRHVCGQTTNRHLTYPVGNSEQKDGGVESRMELLPSGRDANLQRRVFTVEQILASVLPARRRNGGDDRRAEVSADAGAQESPGVCLRARLPDKDAGLPDEGALKAAHESRSAFLRMTTASLTRGTR